MKVETRNLQVRAADGEKFVLEGRAVSYDEVSSNELAPGVREKIVAGCFRDSLADKTDVLALLNHDRQALPLGRLSNGTLKLVDSAEGLDMRVQLDKSNSQHRDVYAAVKRGDIAEMSFAFIPEDEDYVEGVYENQKCSVRSILRASLRDVSVVTSAFYGDGATTVDARATDVAWRAQAQARLNAADDVFNKARLENATRQIA